MGKKIIIMDLSASRIIVPTSGLFFCGALAVVTNVLISVTSTNALSADVIFVREADNNSWEAIN